MTPTAGLAATIASAYRAGPYRLPDGRTLASYFDPYHLAGDPALLADTAAALADLLPTGTQAVAGPALAAVPLVTAVSLHTGLPAAYLRPAPKPHGTGRHIEGTDLDGWRTVLLDDTARSGTNLLNSARLLRTAGAHVDTAVCVLDRAAGAAELLGAHGLALHALIRDPGEDPGGDRRAALFDLDGVLLDSAAAVRTALAAVTTCATRRRVAPVDLPADALRRPRCEVLARMGVTDPDTACDRWWDGAVAAALPVPFPGVLAGLAGLRTSGIATGVVTLQDRDRLSWWIPPPLADLLDVVITRQDAPAKPAPDGLHTALDRLGVTPANALFVGDSPDDMTAARAAGALALGAGWGWHPPDALRTAGAVDVLSGPSCIGPALLLHLASAGGR